MRVQTAHWAPSSGCVPGPLLARGHGACYCFPWKTQGAGKWSATSEKTERNGGRDPLRSGSLARLARTEKGQARRTNSNRALVCPGLKPQGTELHLPEHKDVKPGFIELHKSGCNQLWET